MTAEELIAALIVSNGGSLLLAREAMADSYRGCMLQISEHMESDAYIFRIVNSSEVELDGNGQVPGSDNQDSDLS
jgi:hypothetical protein